MYYNECNTRDKKVCTFPQAFKTLNNSIQMFGCTNF